MRIDVQADASAVAERAATVLADALVGAVQARGQATVAFSGGSTPAATLRILATKPVPWHRVHIAQVDERIAPDGHPDRNLAMLDETLLSHIHPASVAAMPVARAADDAAASATHYEAVLGDISGRPITIDVLQLGLGADGHTASLIPGDPVLKVIDRDVAITGEYQGRRRMTLTAPVLRRARHTVWIVTGAAKRDALEKLRAGDPSIPASLVVQGETSDAANVVIADIGT